MNELPCDTEQAAEDDVEALLGPQLPPEVAEAAERLFQLYHEREHQGVTYDESVPLGAEQIIESIKVRSINTQPELPRLFRQIIENHNARRAILELDSEMSQAQWRQLKELSLDMKKSLRPGAEIFLRQQAGPGWGGSNDF